LKRGGDGEEKDFSVIKRRHTKEGRVKNGKGLVAWGKNDSTPLDRRGVGCVGEVLKRRRGGEKRGKVGRRVLSRGE